MSVCGEALEVVGQCSLGVSFGENVFEHDFLLFGVSVPILGTDFLTNYKCMHAWWM